MMTESSSQNLTCSRIFRFWLPLATTWLLMSVEGPYLAALIARLPEAVINLAAYGVAFAFALVAEAPVIMLMSVTTALCRGRQSYLKLRRFTVLLSGGVTIFLALLALPAVFDPLGTDILGLQPEVADKVRLALWALLPWPAAIGMRRFYQGVLIADGRTRRVAVGTAARLLSMSLTGISLAYFDIPGVLTGALALSAGVAVEAFVARRLAFPAIATFLSRDDEGQTMSMGQIWNYYLPLALTPFIALCVQPIITIFLSRGTAPLESLAVLPVLLGLTFVFRALGLSYQEAAIALVGPKLEQRRIVGRFALGLGLFCAGLLGLIALTPLADLWLIKVAGLTPELADFSALPLMLMAIMPGLTVWITWQRSLLLVSKITVPISLSTLLEVLTIIILLALTINRFAVPGITLAALALTAGRLAGILYLEFYCRRLPGGRNKGVA